jgi:hypothetical protein
MLYKEARLQPLEIELNLISQTFAAYTAQLDLGHPLHIQADRVTCTRRRNTRLARLVLALLKAETVNPIAYPL